MGPSQVIGGPGLSTNWRTGGIRSLGADHEGQRFVSRVFQAKGWHDARPVGGQV